MRLEDFYYFDETSDLDTSSIVIFEILAEGSSVAGSVVKFDNMWVGSPRVVNNAFTYHPHEDFNGTDEFTYVAENEYQTSPAATVSITVNPVNDMPYGHEYDFIMTEDTEYSGTLSGEDVEDDPLTFHEGHQPWGGVFTITNSSTGDFTYVPYPDFAGFDYFSFVVNDGEYNSDTTWVRARVNNVNDDPVLTFLSDTATFEDIPLSILLEASDAENEDSELTITSSNDSVYYEYYNDSLHMYPYPNWHGTSDFSVLINDHEQPGDIIDSAIVIESVPAELFGSTEMYVDNYDEECEYDEGSESPDVVYAYTATQDMVLDLDLCFSSYDTKLYVYENEIGNFATTVDGDDACDDDFYRPYDSTACYDWTSAIWGMNATAGNTYYIVVDGWGSDWGDYYLTIEESSSDTEAYLSFDGVDDYVKLGEGIVSTYTDFTFMCWFYTDANNNWARLMDFGSGTGINMFLTTSYSGSNVPRFAIKKSGGGEQQLTSATALNQGEWYHIAVTINSDENKGMLYIDGEVVAQNNNMTNTPSDLGYTSSNYFGKSQYNDPYLEGGMDDISMWSIALDQDAIQSIMDEGTDEDIDHLEGFWSLNEGSGDQALDASSNNYHGTILGCTWVVEDEEESSFVGINNNDLARKTIDLQDRNNARPQRATAFQSFTLTVVDVNDPPIAFGNQLYVSEDDTMYAYVEALDGDPHTLEQDIQSIVYSVATAPEHGQLELDSISGEFIYIPYPDFFGLDSFVYVATDDGTSNGVEDSKSSNATIFMEVGPVNDAPVLSSLVDTSIYEDSHLVVSVLATDVDNSNLEMNANSSTHNVDVFIDDTLLFVHPEENWNGSVTVTVSVTDNMTRATDVEQFTLTVTPVNDAPYFTMEDFSLASDITAGVDTWILADDVDSDHFFILEGAPSWLMMEGSRMYGQPDQDSVYVFTLSVSDSEHVVSEQFTMSIVDHRPDIISLTDVPMDQGRQMKLLWEPGHLDQEGYFTQFSIWREVLTDSADLWDFIVSVPWIGVDEEYSRVVPTLGDSTADGIHHSTFRVTAHTEDVDFYHDSEPVVGYSVDNLHPTVPQGLMAVQNGAGVILQWLTAEDEDFSYHNVYKNSLDSVDPATIFTTSDSFYVDLDIADGSWQYWVTAVDSAGNESESSDIVSVLLANDKEVAIPTVYALEQNYPNPFNPSTQIRYALPEETMVTISIYDMMGRKVRTLISQSQSPGYHTTLWNATNDNGRSVSAGMYIYTIQAGIYQQMKKMVLLK